LNRSSIARPDASPADSTILTTRSLHNQPRQSILEAVASQQDTNGELETDEEAQC
jgi:hypothetical protein